MDFHEFHHPVSSNMAMENTLFIGDFPIDTLILSGCPVATFDCRRVVGLPLNLSIKTSRRLGGAVERTVSRINLI